MPVKFHCCPFFEFVADHPPTKNLFLQNVELKLKEEVFFGDIKALVGPAEQYDQPMAYERVKVEILELMK